MTESEIRIDFDTALANTAMKFVDRAGDYCDQDPAEKICDEFHDAMADVIDKYCVMMNMPSCVYDADGNKKGGK